MKKSEAEKLICPFIYNSNTNGGAHVNCVTTKCMAWKDTTKKRKVYYNMTKTAIECYIAKGWVEEGNDLVFTEKEPTGYCKRLGNE